MLRDWHNAYLWLVTNNEESHFPFPVSFPDPSILRPGCDSQNSLTFSPLQPTLPAKSCVYGKSWPSPLYMCLGANWILILPFFSFPPSIPTSSTSECAPPQGTSSWAPGSMCSSNTVLPYRLIAFVTHSFLCLVLLKAFLPAGFSICPPQPDTRCRCLISDSSSFLYFVTNAPPSGSLLWFPLSPVLSSQKTDSSLFRLSSGPCGVCPLPHGDM